MITIHLIFSTLNTKRKDVLLQEIECQVLHNTPRYIIKPLEYDTNAFYCFYQKKRRKQNNSLKPDIQHLIQIQSAFTKSHSTNFLRFHVYNFISICSKAMKLMNDTTNNR